MEAVYDSEKIKGFCRDETRFQLGMKEKLENVKKNNFLKKVLYSQMWK